MLLWPVDNKIIVSLSSGGVKEEQVLDAFKILFNDNQVTLSDLCSTSDRCLTLGQSCAGEYLRWNRELCDHCQWHWESLQEARSENTAGRSSSRHEHGWSSSYSQSKHLCNHGWERFRESRSEGRLAGEKYLEVEAEEDNTQLCNRDWHILRSICTRIKRWKHKSVGQFQGTKTFKELIDFSDTGMFRGKDLMVDLCCLLVVASSAFALVLMFIGKAKIHVHFGRIRVFHRKGQPIDLQRLFQMFDAQCGFTQTTIDFSQIIMGCTQIGMIRW